MNSEYLFGPTTEKMTKKEGIRRDKIAKQFGGSFVGPVSLPGNQVKGWFSIDNKGEPFNSRLASEILEACGV